MCSHFADHGEISAVNVQLVGIANNMLVLAQVRSAGAQHTWLSSPSLPYLVCKFCLPGLALLAAAGGITSCVQ